MKPQFRPVPDFGNSATRWFSVGQCYERHCSHLRFPHLRSSTTRFQGGQTTVATTMIKSGAIQATRWREAGRNELSTTKFTTVNPKEKEH
ncbi:unnamed protein product [Haemonchus placei]|uniref:Uncharacterized protein n=1 Tax=Haemonchus placei TaxID=6290 RepID=A0A0N4WTG1_HAEPC|nr:unnamed protein product [Haemonchus placei]